MSTSTSSGIPKQVAGAHEARRLLRGVDVEHAAEVARLVGDDPDRAARRGGRTRTRRCAPSAGEISSSRPPSSSAARDVADVVDLAGLARARRGRARTPGGSTVGQRMRPLAGVLRQVVEQVAREQRGVDVGRRDEVADAVALVHARAAERGGVDSSPVTFATTPGPVRNMLALLGHDHEVGQRRRVGAAARPRRRRSTEICGTRPGERTCWRKIRP